MKSEPSTKDFLSGIPDVSNSNLINEDLHISANYRDPFLTENSLDPAPGTVGTIVDKITRDNLFPEIKQVTWPEVKYFGLISEKQKNNLVGLVSINGRNFLIKPGDIISQLQFGIYKDSLVLKLENQIRTIKKAAL